MTRTDPSYFRRLYADDPDPWGFESRWYERRKYDLTLAALPRPRYRAAFEPGCSHGVLTERLAARCDALLAVDLLEAVAERARARVAALPWVEVGAMDVPEEWPAGPFDLVVLSEVAYYFGGDALGLVLDRAAGCLEPGGHLVAVHWRGETDYPSTGAEVHRRVDARPDLRHLASYADEDFLLDVHERS